jgi:hypothetical protein
MGWVKQEDVTNTCPWSNSRIPTALLDLLLATLSSLSPSHYAAKLSLSLSHSPGKKKAR